MPLIAVQSVPCPDTDTSPYGIATALFCGRLVRDRFNFLNQYSNAHWVDSVDPIPSPDATSMTDLMDRRAQELIAQGSVATQWSGGVDSTSLLLALIRNGIKKDNLQILLDSNSISEYPKLFSWLQEEKYDCKVIKDWKTALSTCDTDVITNGWCADQLFGSMFFHEAPTLYDRSLEELFEDLFLLGKKIPEKDIHNAIAVFKQMGKELFDVDITIAAELGWLINFCLKWTWVSTFNELFLAGTKNQFKTQVFYNTPYFQSWAVNNFLEIHKNNVYGTDARHYKKQLKEYCYSVFPDKDYLINKTKVPSWNSTLSCRDPKQTGLFEKIIYKTDKGYDIYKLPTTVPYHRLAELEKEIFTKYCKQ